MSLALDDLAKLPSSTDTRSVPPAKPTAAASRNKTGMYCANCDGDVCSMAEIIETTVEISMTKTGVEKFHHRRAERREVARRAAGNQIAVHHDRFVDPNAAGVFQIVLDAKRTGDAPAFENFGGDWNPTAVTDERDELALLKKFTRERPHLGVAPQFVRHETAGHEQSAKIFTVRVLQKQIRRGGITVLAGVGFDFRRGAFQSEPGFL